MPPQPKPIVASKGDDEVILGENYDDPIKNKNGDSPISPEISPTKVPDIDLGLNEKNSDKNNNQQNFEQKNEAGKAEENRDELEKILNLKNLSPISKKNSGNKHNDNVIENKEEDLNKYLVLKAVEEKQNKENEKEVITISKENDISEKKQQEESPNKKPEGIENEDKQSIEKGSKEQSNNSAATQLEVHSEKGNTKEPNQEEIKNQVIYNNKNEIKNEKIPEATKGETSIEKEIKQEEKKEKSTEVSSNEVKIVKEDIKEKTDAVNISETKKEDSEKQIEVEKEKIIKELVDSVLESTLKIEIGKMDNEIKKIEGTEKDNNEHKETQKTKDAEIPTSGETSKTHETFNEKEKKDTSKEIKVEPSQQEIQPSKEEAKVENDVNPSPKINISGSMKEPLPLTQKNLEMFDNENDNKATDVSKEVNKENKDKLNEPNEAEGKEDLIETINLKTLSFEEDSKEINHHEIADELRKEQENTDNQVADYKTKLLIRILLEFLDYDNEINILLAGYFSKIILSLINKDRTTLFNLLFEKHWTERLIYHSYSKSISEILIKILSSDEISQVELKDPTIPLNDSRKEDLMNSILEKLIESEYNEIIMSLTLIICKIMETKIMSTFFNSKQVIEKLLFLTKRHHPMALRAGLTIFISYIKSFINSKDMETNDTYKILKPYLKDLIKYLRSIFDQIKTIEIQLNQTYGKTQILGMVLLKIVEYFSNLIQLRDKELCEEMRGSGLSILLLNLFEEFYMNSNLHSKLFNFFKEALESDIPSLYESVTLDSNIAVFIMNSMANEQIPYSQKSPKYFIKPCIVYLTKIANLLVEQGKKKPLIREYLKKIQEWTKFVFGDLEKKNKREKVTVKKSGLGRGPFDLDLDSESAVLKSVISKLCEYSKNETDNQTMPDTEDFFQAEENLEEDYDLERKEEIMKILNAKEEEIEEIVKIEETKIESSFESTYGESGYWSSMSSEMNLEQLKEDFK